MDNNKYFYLGGLISLTLFLLFGTLFSYILFNKIKNKTYGLKKENYVSVSLVIPEKKVSHKKNDSKKRSVIKKTSLQSSNKVENLDVNDLFSDVWTSKIKITKKKKKVNSKRLAQLQKKIKTTQENKVDLVSEKIEQEDGLKREKEAASTASEVNEYLAKIQALVYKHFHVPPNTQGQSVKTVIELDPFGKVLDFRVLQYSQSSVLNEEVDKMKERLLHVVFPLNPQHQNSTTVVVLISKE